MGQPRDRLGLLRDRRCRSSRASPEIVDSLTLFPRGNFTIDNDARIALTGAIGFGAGVVVIAAPLGGVRRNDAAEEAVAAGGRRSATGKRVRHRARRTLRCCAL